jgi:uncharacterized protein YjlB
MKRVNPDTPVKQIVLKRNKNFPNSKLPVLIYRNAINLPAQKNKAAAIAQKIFIKNGWSNSWKNGIYDYHHYHSTTHECMAVCMGAAFVILGGPSGKRVKLNLGDVLVIPVGVGHKCATKTSDFLCVGAYPGGKDYDIKLGNAEEYKEACKRINNISLPENDPVFGEQGYLKSFWE